MWIFRYARFVRLRNGGKRLSVRSLPRLLILGPILAVQVVLIGMVIVILSFIVTSLPRSLGMFARAYRATSLSDKTESPSQNLRGGEVRQAGYQGKISETRHGASTRSDDLRRRLNELRSVRTGHPAHRPQKRGGQYGK